MLNRGHKSLESLAVYGTTIFNTFETLKSDIPDCKCEIENNNS